jgi:hypothetical protein
MNVAVKAGSTASQPLDKLAQVGKTPEKVKHPLLNRAKNKYLTFELAKELYDYSKQTGGMLMESYQNSLSCSTLLLQAGNEITTKYCKQRWCMVCNRIRTGNLINGYEEPLKKLENKYFVTLTVPNVKANDLQKTIVYMLAELKRIQETFKKRKTPINGIRKLECTYNNTRGDFHPHLHLIVSGQEVANEILSEWLKRFPEASHLAQHATPATDGSVKELFKYFTKLITKVDGKVQVSIPALDTIFTAMKTRRVFQPLGKIKKVSEEIEEIQSQEYEIEEQHEIHQWEQESYDWVNIATGECMTAFCPGYALLKIIDAIREPDKPPPKIYLN